MPSLITRRRSIAATAAVAAAIALVPATALADAPVHLHSQSTFAGSIELCGLAVDIDTATTNNYFGRDDGTTSSTVSFRGTITNPLTARFVVYSVAGTVTQPAAVVDEAANTITFAATYRGLNLQFRTASGPVLRAAGTLTTTDTYDRETFALIASTSFSHGSLLGPGASDICDVLTAELT